MEPAERLQGRSAPLPQICLLSTWSQRHTVSHTLFGKVPSPVVLGVPSGSMELQGTHTTQFCAPVRIEATDDVDRGLRAMMWPSSTVQTLFCGGWRIGSISTKGGQGSSGSRGRGEQLSAGHCVLPGQKRGWED